MPRRHYLPKGSPLPPDPAPLRTALADVNHALAVVVRELAVSDDVADPLLAALYQLRRDAQFAIVVFGEPEREVASMHETSRTAALHAALRLNAGLATAYQERWGPPRTILVACHAVARLIQQLHAARPDQPNARWN